MQKHITKCTEFLSLYFIIIAKIYRNRAVDTRKQESLLNNYISEILKRKNVEVILVIQFEGK